MWLNYGDANTKYFHLQTIQRHSQSCVVTLKDDIGLWLIGEPLMQLWEFSRVIRCPPIFLSFVWKDCQSSWKGLLEIDLSILFL